jgi:MFS family permease
VLFAEGPERNRALSVWGGAGAGGLVLGSLLGGVLTQTLGWEAVFMVNVPLALLALLAGLVLIPPDAEREAGRRFDVPGALTATSGTTLLVLGLVRGPEVGWGSTGVVAALAAGVVLLATFLAIERRSRDPLMPLRLFANRNLSVGAAITFMALATLGSVLYFLTLYFQEVRGYDALETGLAFVLPTAIIVLGSGIGGRLATRFGVRATLAVSLALAASGAVVVAAVMSPDVSYTALIPGLILLSLGDGIVYTVMFIAASTGVAERDQGVASGIASTGTQVGSAVGLAVLVAVAGVGAGAVTTDGLRAGILGAAAGLALTVLVALALERTRQPHARAAEAPGHA